MPISSPWVIRPAQERDIPDLLQMLVGQTPWAELGYDATCSAALVDRPPGEIQVATDPDDRPVGFLRWRADAFLGQPYLHLLAVAPERRRQRVGEALMAWLEAEVFEHRRAANLFLCVSAFNHPARAFYQRLGYTEVGVLAAYLREGLDELLLRKSARPLLGAVEESRDP
jgi:ribosomal protein S18 acetylase RimI-like enzyme